MIFLKKIISSFFGILVGLINGTVGAGGGLIAVPLIGKFGVEQKVSHSTAVALLLPISAISAINYLRSGYVSFFDATPFILPAVLGAVAGVFLMGKIPTSWLKRVFAIFMIYSGGRLFF